MSKKEEEKYEVEKITGERFYKNRRQYRIHWLGYGSSDDTWEDEDDLDCPDILQKFKDEKMANKLGNSLKEGSGKDIDKNNPPVLIIKYKDFGGKSHVRVQLKDNTYATFLKEFIDSHYPKLPHMK